MDASTSYDRSWATATASGSAVRAAAATSLDDGQAGSDSSTAIDTALVYPEDDDEAYARPHDGIAACEGDGFRYAHHHPASSLSPFPIDPACPHDEYELPTPSRVSSPALKAARARRRRTFSGGTNGGGPFFTLRSALVASASVFIHPQRIARQAVLAFQSLTHSLSSGSSNAFPTSSYKSLPTSPYSSAASTRHRTSSATSPTSRRPQHPHLPRRRDSTSHSSYYHPRTLSARTRWTLLAVLILAIGIITGITKLIIYILNPDKEPKAWQHFCTSQDEFPHALADSLAPVDIFVGVFSVDASYERRQLIRSTYATHTLPHDVESGAQLANVQLKFILGRPRKAHARAVALEMEAYNDIVVLDMEENMNQGKTYAYFRWASENATVPILLAHQEAASNAAEHGTVAAPLRTVVGWKKADYVVKADDDAFIVLSELERHLRVAPRTGTYWGYLIRNWFMGGECYALSNDLVQYIATSPDIGRYTHGKEDKKVAQWMNLHPNATSLNWVSERCWIYDGPKAGTAYSHGYLFPDYVATLRRRAAQEALLEAESAPNHAAAAAAAAPAAGDSDDALSPNGLAAEPRRSAEWRRKHSASTVSKWKRPYVPPRPGMSVEEEIEALVEGGGRWDGVWVRPNKVGAWAFEEGVYHAGLAPILTSSSGQGHDGSVHDYAAADEEFGHEPRVWVPFGSLVFEADDPRIVRASSSSSSKLRAQGAGARLREEVDHDAASGLALYNVSVSVAELDELRASSLHGRSPRSAPPLPPRSQPDEKDSKADNAAAADPPLRFSKRASTSWDSVRAGPDRVLHDVGGGLAGGAGAHWDGHALVPSRYVPLATGHRRPPGGYTPLSTTSSSSSSTMSSSESTSPIDGPTEALLRGNLTPEQRLRARRHLYRPHGGTVVVHYLKKSEWFLETALALLGRDVLWPDANAGAAAVLSRAHPHGGRRGGGGGGVAMGGRAREWRMWPSPVVVPGPSEKEARIL